MKLWRLAACAALIIGTMFAFQRPFREFNGVEYRIGEIPLPTDYKDQAEWTFARLMYPPAAGRRRGGGFGAGFGGGGGFRGGFGGGSCRGFGGLDWEQGCSIWTQDFPRADRHFSQAVRRLTRLAVRSVEQPVNLDEGDAYDWPWLYSVQAGRWNLSDKQVAALREYLLRGGFLMADDFWGEDDWQNFQSNMKRVFPDRDIVDLPNDAGIFHSVYDLSGRYQVASQGSVNRGVTFKCEPCPDKWRGISDDRNRVVVAITFQSDVGDSWEWADAPTYPAESAALGIRIGVNYIVYAMTH